MTTELQNFKFGQQRVRTFHDKAGEIWFVAADVAKILEYQSAKDFTRGLDEDEKGRQFVPTPGGRQELLTISEAGLYAALVRSKAERVAPFRRWVTHEVLPTIRKTGAYRVPQVATSNPATLRALDELALCQAARGLIQADHLEAKARVILARGLGERPQLEPATRPLYAQDFLQEKGVNKDQLKHIAPTFGKRIKAKYTLEHGTEPEKYPLNLSNGQVRQVNAYTGKDRPLFEDVWAKYYTEESLTK